MVPGFSMGLGVKKAALSSRLDSVNGFWSGVLAGKPEADAANDGDDSYHDDPHHSSTLHARTSAKASE